MSDVWVWPFHRRHTAEPLRLASDADLSAALANLPSAVERPARGLLLAARDLFTAADYLNRKHPENRPPPDGVQL